MVKITQFLSHREAQMAAEALKERGIHTEIVGSRDYSSHVLGTDGGVFALHVDENKVLESEEILRLSRLSLVEDEGNASESPAADPRPYLKKCILFAILAIVIAPLITNYVSLRNLVFYWRAESRWGKKIFMSILVVLLQIPGCISGYFIIQSLPWQ